MSEIISSSGNCGYLKFDTCDSLVSYQSLSVSLVFLVAELTVFEVSSASVVALIHCQTLCQTNKQTYQQLLLSFAWFSVSAAMMMIILIRLLKDEEDKCDKIISCCCCCCCFFSREKLACSRVCCFHRCPSSSSAAARPHRRRPYLSRPPGCRDLPLSFRRLHQET